jgi:ABC-type branched-subunit amino acid transport system substrate-binding protein
MFVSARSPRYLTEAVLCCCLAFPACKGEPSNNAPEDNLVLGALLPFTGELAAYGADYERALILAAERVNEAGGIAGHKLELVSRDTHSELERGLESGRELLSMGLTGFIGAEEPNLTAKLGAEIGRQGVPHLLPSISSPRAAGRAPGTDWFHIAPGPRILGCVLGTRLYEDGRERVIVVNENNPFLFAMAREIVTQYNTLFDPATDAHRDTAIALPFQPEQDSYASLMESVAMKKPDALVLLAYPDSGAKIAADWNVTGQHAALYLPPTLQTEVFLINTQPGTLEGSLGIGVELPEDQEQFVARYLSRWSGEAPVPGAFFYYDALVLWALSTQAAYAETGGVRPSVSAVQEKLTAVSQAGAQVITWDEVSRGLALAREGTAIDYRGASGELDLGEDGELVSDTNTRFWVIRDGRMVPEAGGYCAPTSR